MKTSNKLLALLVLALICSLLAHTFYLIPHLEAREVWATPYLLSPDAPPEYAEVESDTLHGDYHYLWTNFPEVMLDPRAAGRATTWNFRAGQVGHSYGHVQLKIERDTLFIRHDLAPMQAVPADDTSLVAIAVHVAAKQLKGICVVGDGKVVNLKKGGLVSTETGPRYNSPIPLPLAFDHFDLSLSDGGDADLELDAALIRLSVNGRDSAPAHSAVALSGSTGKLQILQRGDLVQLKAYELAADSVWVDSKTRLAANEGLIKVQARRYLDARLNGWGNVLYTGHPQVKKQEGHSGRVVDANRYND